MVKKKSKNKIRKYINQRKKQNLDKFTKIFTVTLFMSSLGLSILDAVNNNFCINFIATITVSIGIGGTLFKQFYENYDKDTLIKSIVSIILLGFFVYGGIRLILWVNNDFIHKSLNSALISIADHYQYSIPHWVHFSEKYLYPHIRKIIFFMYDIVSNMLIILFLSSLTVLFSRLLLIWIKKYQK